MQMEALAEAAFIVGFRPPYPDEKRYAYKRELLEFLLYTNSHLKNFLPAIDSQS